jgi:hypothetical protein
MDSSTDNTGSYMSSRIRELFSYTNIESVWSSVVVSNTRPFPAALFTKPRVALKQGTHWCKRTKSMLFETNSLLSLVQIRLNSHKDS